MNVKENASTKNVAISSDKMTIVKEPNGNDVLLGQGHYRHPGNQRLNEIVDAKVLEYKTATRPFKTYMVHEIVQRLRKKEGVRFLKELAPKGWVVVHDDKDAKEKISQRFQYSMRKMAENPHVVQDKQVKSTPPTEAVPAPQPHLVWNGTTVKVPFLPVFHQLQKSSVMVDDDINEVSERLLECFHIIGVQESFNYEDANAILTTMSEDLKMQMNLWKPLGARGVIVELVNLTGDLIMFQRNSRYVLEAATGLFDSYKHTLCQSRRLTTLSVQDHVTTFSTNQPNVNNNNNNNNNSSSSSNKKTTARNGNNLESEAKDPSRRGPLPVFSDRPVQDSKPTKYKGSIPSSICVRRENIMVPASNDRPFSDTTKSTKAASSSRPEKGEKKESFVKRPSPKRVEPKATQPSNSKKPDTDSLAMHASDSMLGRFDEAKAAFSRWESGAKAQNTTKAANYPAPTTNENAVDSMRRLSLPPKVASNNEIRTYVDMYPPVGPPVATWSEARSSHQEMKGESIYGGDPYKSTAKIASRSRFPLSGGKDNGSNNEVSHPHYSEERGGPSVNEEMKFDNNPEVEPYQTETSMEHNTDSIRRLSLTGGSDYNHSDMRDSRDIYEPLPLEHWGETLTNQEMKCDSSFDDDDPCTENNPAPKQSWIPSTFFGVPPPSSQHANLKKTSPPSPAGSFCSHISVEMRSLPSPSPSFSSRLSVDVFSLPSPSNSFNSKCSLARNSLQSARMDEAPSPSMFSSDQSDGPRASQPDALLFGEGQGYQEAAPMLGADSSHLDAVPPTIFVDSCSIGSAA